VRTRSDFPVLHFQPPMARHRPRQFFGVVCHCFWFEESDREGSKGPVVRCFSRCFERWLVAIVLPGSFIVLGVRLGQVVLVFFCPRLSPMLLLFWEKGLLRNFSNHQLYRLPDAPPNRRKSEQETKIHHTVAIRFRSNLGCLNAYSHFQSKGVLE
jgi:hypothetical protein